MVLSISFFYDIILSKEKPMKDVLTIIKNGEKTFKENYSLTPYPFSRQLFLIDDELYLKNNDVYQNINSIKGIVENGFKDKLTGCYTKNYLYSYIESLIAENANFALIFGDIDNFKEVNKIFGHFKADEILKILGQTFKDNLNSEDYIFRFGGDEFFILSKNCDLERQLKLYKKINSEFYDRCNVSCSFGIKLYDKSLSIEDNLNSLDKLLYQSKFHGKNYILIGD